MATTAPNRYNRYRHMETKYLPMLLPKWLAVLIEDNEIPFSIFKEKGLPSILSADQIKFYLSFYFTMYGIEDDKLTRFLTHHCYTPFHLPSGKSDRDSMKAFLNGGDQYSAKWGVSSAQIDAMNIEWSLASKRLGISRNKCGYLMGITGDNLVDGKRRNLNYEIRGEGSNVCITVEPVDGPGNACEFARTAFEWFTVAYPMNELLCSDLGEALVKSSCD